MFLEIIGAILALAIGIYWGLGAPGLPGPRDRVLPPGSRRQRTRAFTPLDWLRPRERPSVARRRGGGLFR
ncbi:MAG: hypothetical protein HY704_04535 [Gemmatimonadetes bacterium]|nr:hypothetical protein [Gemmatimonadota bacterium]